MIRRKAKFKYFILCQLTLGRRDSVAIFSILSWVSFRRGMWTLQSQVNRATQLEGWRKSEESNSLLFCFRNVWNILSTLGCTKFWKPIKHWGVRKGWGVKTGCVVIHFIYIGTVNKGGSTLAKSSANQQCKYDCSLPECLRTYFICLRETGGTPRFSMTVWGYTCCPGAIINIACFFSKLSSLDCDYRVPLSSDQMVPLSS